jgi:hypothetical protein
MNEFKLSNWEKIYFPAYRFFNKFNPRDRYNDVRYFVQRGRRGWSDRDAWSVDYYLAEVIPPMLRRLVEYGNGFPAGIMSEDFTEDEWEAHYKKWHKDLLKAADDIDQHKVATDYAEKYEDIEKAMKRVERGLSWVQKNFFQLWD